MCDHWCHNLWKLRSLAAPSDLTSWRAWEREVWNTEPVYTSLLFHHNQWYKCRIETMYPTALVGNPYWLKVCLVVLMLVLLDKCFKGEKALLGWVWIALKRKKNLRLTFFSVGLVHCSRDPQLQKIENVKLKLGLMILFTHLKFILL